MSPLLFHLTFFLFCSLETLNGNVSAPVHYDIFKCEIKCMGKNDSELRDILSVRAYLL